jgi:predicted TPR repeat methyltransferase
LASEVRAATGGRRFTRALDLGCGTGLCGAWMKACAEHLTGVDLSQGMLEKARGLGLYDDLLQGDVAEHVASLATAPDLVVAADVFIYVGELREVFEGLARAMPPGGVFAFSLERAGDAGPGVVLQPSLRYAHSARYLRELAAATGWRIERLAEAPIREDQRESIPGLYAVLVR